MAREMKDSGIEWIGEIPCEWDIRKLKYCSEFIQDKYSDKNGELEYIGLENISSWSGKYISTDSQYDRAQSLLFQAEDILWGKLRPYLAKVYHTKKSGCCSSEFCVIRVSKDYSIRYFWNLLISSEFVYAIDRSTYGTKMPRANAEFIRNTFIPVPDKHEQQAIADFLDTQCAHIDSVIEKTRAAIEEYKRLKQSVITQAVTKGIRPNREMKDSGIEWIGEIPKEWTTPKMGTICSVITDYVASGSFASLAENVEYLDHPDFAMLIRTVDVSNKGHNQKPVYINRKAYEFLHNSNLSGGELMFPNIGASVGDVYLVPILYKHMSLAPNAIMVKTKYIDRYYYYYYQSKSGRLSIEDIAQSTAQAKFNKTEFRQLRVLLPPNHEQSEIVAYLDEKTAAIDSLIQKKEQLITELEAYKKSLIYEYVTGKKEAPAHAH